MDKHEAAELGIRLLAVFNLIILLSGLPALLSYADVAANTNIAWRFSVWNIPLLGSSLLISALLWFRARAIAEWMWRDRKGGARRAALTATELKMVLFSAVGLYLLVSVLPGALQFLAYLAQKIVNKTPFMGWADAGNAIGFLIRVAIASWLLFDSDRIVSVLDGGKKKASRSKTA
jgi:hypothetical protein